MQHTQKISALRPLTLFSGLSVHCVRPRALPLGTLPSPPTPQARTLPGLPPPPSLPLVHMFATISTRPKAKFYDFIVRVTACPAFPPPSARPQLSRPAHGIIRQSAGTHCQEHGRCLPDTAANEWWLEFWPLPYLRT